MKNISIDEEEYNLEMIITNNNKNNNNTNEKWFKYNI